MLDPVYVGQYPSFGKFGPSTTTIDYPPHTHSVRFSCYFTLNYTFTSSFLCTSYNRSAAARSSHYHVVVRQIVGPDSGRNDSSQRALPRVPLRTTAILSRDISRKPCSPLRYGFLSLMRTFSLFWDCRTYQLHYPRRSCNSDYTGFAVSGKPIDPLAVLPTINLFNGNGYYITETMENFSDIPQKRVQLYPDKMATAYNPSIFPANSSCPSKPDCANQQSMLACTQPTQPRRSCYGSCTFNT